MSSCFLCVSMTTTGVKEYSHLTVCLCERLHMAAALGWKSWSETLRSWKQSSSPEDPWLNYAWLINCYTIFTSCSDPAPQKQNRCLLVFLIFLHFKSVWHHFGFVVQTKYPKQAPSIPVLLSVPWVAGHGATVCQVGASVGVHTSTQPLTAALVPGVQHMQHLITAYGQRAVVQLAGNVEVDPYVEGVARS